jgi:hypothetical protein
MRKAMRRPHWMSASVVALAALGAGPAVGADLATKAPPAPVYPPPPFTWTGFYIGGNVGGDWAQGTVTDNATGGTFGTGERGSFMGGGQLGYNYQVGNVVFGVDGFIDGIASGNNNTSDIVTGLPAINSRETRMRLGFRQWEAASASLAPVLTIGCSTGKAAAVGWDTMRGFPI